jgi:hypothetical protein
VTLRFVVGQAQERYIRPMDCTAYRIVLDDHARLPWRFFGRLRAARPLIAG